MSISLSEAREAAEQLKKLQDAAQLLPTLEANENKAQSEQAIEILRTNILQENSKLYTQFQAVGQEYVAQFEQTLQAVKELSAKLKELLTVKRHIQDNATRYTHALYQHGVQFLGKNPYGYGLESEGYIGDVVPGRLDYNLSIPGNAIAGEIFRIISNI